MTEQTDSEKEADIQEFVKFLTPHIANDLLEIYRVFKTSDLHDVIFDKFDAATRIVLDANPDLRVGLGRLAVVDRDPKLRLETFWILQPLMFSDYEARSIIWEQLLQDSDPSTVAKVIELLEEDLHDTASVPLQDILYAAAHLNKAKEQHAN